MAQPQVQIIQTGGNLGIVVNKYETRPLLMMSGVAVSGKIALLELHTIYSVDDAIALGLDAAYDTTNSTKVHYHISQFYSIAGNVGRELNIFLMANTVTMANMTDDTVSTYTKAAIAAMGQGVIMVGITRNPPSGYTPDVTDQLDADTVTAALNAKTMRANYEAINRYVEFVIEARAIVYASLSSIKDLTALSRKGVYVMAGNSTSGDKGADVGLALGKAVSDQCHRNIGRVASGALPITTAYIANSTVLVDGIDSAVQALANKGYLVYRIQQGRSGYYFSDDTGATIQTEDTATLANLRVLDKASAITFDVLVDYLKDNVPVDPSTGKLSVGFCADLKRKIESQIVGNMVDAVLSPEISGVEATVDPNQNVISTSKVVALIEVTPTGYAKQLQGKIGLNNPFS